MMATTTVDEALDALGDLLTQRDESIALAETGDEEIKALVVEIELEIQKSARTIAEGSGVLPDPSKPMLLSWDDGNSYTCIVESIAYDFGKKTIVATVAMVGYPPQREVVELERLRPWAPHTPPLAAGARCHAVNPESGRWAPAIVERLTLKGTVAVGFLALQIPEEGGSAGLTKVISNGDLAPHLVSTGRCPRVLKKKLENMTAEEKAAHAEAERRKKRERTEEKIKASSNKLEAAAAAWQSLAQVARPQPPAPVVPAAAPTVGARVIPKQR